MLQARNIVQLQNSSSITKKTQPNKQQNTYVFLLKCLF